MMVHKAKLFKDDEALAEMLVTPKPGAVKALGRKVKNFDKKFGMLMLLTLWWKEAAHKFSQNETFKTFLLNTGKKIIVEASPRDFIWGIGLGKDRPEAQHPNTMARLKLAWLCINGGA